MRDNSAAIQILSALVGFDTTSHKSNLELMAYVESYLANYGLISRRVPSKCGTKTSLYATVGPNLAGGIVLSGHTDVVPASTEEWQSDPFHLTVRNYARRPAHISGEACGLSQ